jgi:hypothetical protein
MIKYFNGMCGNIEENNFEFEYDLTLDEKSRYTEVATRILEKHIKENYKLHLGIIFFVQECKNPPDDGYFILTKHVAYNAGLMKLGMELEKQENI